VEETTTTLEVVQETDVALESSGEVPETETTGSFFRSLTGRTIDVSKRLLKTPQLFVLVGIFGLAGVYFVARVSWMKKRQQQ